MFIRLYRSTPFVQQIFIIIAAALLWIPRLFNIAKSTALDYNEPVFSLFFNNIKILPLFSAIFAFFLLLLSAIIEQRILNSDRSHLSMRSFPILLFLTLSATPHAALFSPIIFSVFILAISLYFIFAIPETIKNDQLIFFAAFFIGIALIFYLPMLFLAALFFPIFFVSDFSFKKLVIVILGFLLPFIWLFGILYLISDINLIIHLWEQKNPLTFSLSSIQSDIVGVATSVLLIILYIIFISNILIRFSERRAIIRRRITLSIFLVISILIGAFFSYDFFEHLSLLSIPMVVLISYYYSESSESSWIDYTLLCSLLMLILYPYLQL